MPETNQTLFKYSCLLGGICLCAALRVDSSNYTGSVGSGSHGVSDACMNEGMNKQIK